MHSTTWKFLLLDTKTESGNDFEIHNCAFEVAFDEATQLHIQWCIFTHQAKFNLGG